MNETTTKNEPLDAQVCRAMRALCDTIANQDVPAGTAVWEAFGYADELVVKLVAEYHTMRRKLELGGLA